MRVIRYSMSTDRISTLRLVMSLSSSRSMVIIMSSVIITMPSGDIVMIRRLPSYFMEFNTIVSIILGPIESNMGEIIPDREHCRIHEIREKELVEHEDHSEWDDRILVTDDICIEPWLLHDLSIIEHIMEPCQKGLNPENIRLINKINTYRSERKEKVSCNKNIGKCIEEWLGRLTHHKTSMERKEHSKQKYKIDRNAHEKDRKTKRKKDSFCSECWIPNQQHHQKEIDPHTNNGTKGSLKDEVQRHEIVEENHSKKNPSEHKDIELCHLKCHCKSREEGHDSDLAVIRILQNSIGKARVFRLSLLRD